MKIQVFVSESAIPLSAYRDWKGHGAFNRDRYSDLFKKYEGDRNAYRIYLPLTGKPQVAKKVNVPQAIVDALAAKGYVADDYRAGIAVDLATGRRKVKIGKLLIETPELQKEFNQDPQRQASRLSKTDMLVVISRHPYDIAGASVNRGWTSCLHLTNGGNKEYVIQDVKHGTLVAYLIKADDKNIERPIARVRVYRFEPKQPTKKLGRPPKDAEPVTPPVVDPNNFLFVREPRVYGTPSPQFTKILDAWIDTVNEGRADGLYCVHEDLYTDRVNGEVHLVSSPDTLLQQVQSNTVSDIHKLTVRLNADGKAKLFAAVVEQLKKPMEQCKSILKNLSKLLSICMTVDDAKTLLPKLLVSKVVRDFLNEYDSPFNSWMLILAWHYGAQPAAFKKQAVEVDLHELPQMPSYLPEDIHIPDLIVNFYLANQNVNYYNIASGLMRCFAQPVTVEPQLKKFGTQKFLRETFDMFVNDCSSDDAAECRQVMDTGKNLYDAFDAKFDSDANVQAQLKDHFEDTVLLEVGLMTRDEFHTHVLQRLNSGYRSYPHSIQQAAEMKDQELVTKIIDQLATKGELFNRLIHDDDVMTQITQEQFDEWMKHAKDFTDAINLQRLMRATKYKQLDLRKHLDSDSVEDWFVKQLRMNFDVKTLQMVKPLIDIRKDSLLEKLYAVLKLPKIRAKAKVKW